MPTRPPADAAALLDRVRVGSKLDLRRHDPRETFGWQKERGKAELRGEVSRMAELQKVLFAEGTRSVLVILQAMDAGGKDGTLREVLRGLNPAGVRVAAFGVPSEQELSRDFLWRVHKEVPSVGQIGVFNRSHYEDVLVVRVKKLAPREVWRKRFAHIRRFEQMLLDEGTTIVKLFLHVSNDEQRQRLQDRIDDPDERWKFRRGDLDDRELWPQYMRAYRDALVRTSTPEAPWYVVPGDRKWVRNLVVATILRHTLERMDPQYPPPPEPDIAGLAVP
jgi:PPK2 family polyphosphate:nucleotide phosphotransferase